MEKLINYMLLAACLHRYKNDLEKEIPSVDAIFWN
jgi:hypothetical protein